jgi:hypothetical protein
MKLPRLVHLARILKIPIPAWHRLRSERTEAYLREQLSDASFEFALTYLRFPMTRGTKELIRAFCAERKNSTLDPEDETFFVPLGFNSLHVTNTMTYDREPLPLIVHGCQYSRDQMYQLSNCRRALEERNAIAFGTQQSYHLVSLPELARMWESYGAFIAPSDVSLPLEKRRILNMHELVELRRVLREEYDPLRAQVVLDAIDTVTQAETSGWKLMERQLLTLKEMSDSHRERLNLYFKTIVRAALFMRNWSGGEFPLTATQCGEVDEKMEDKIAVCLASCQEQYAQFAIDLRGWVDSLPTVVIKPQDVDVEYQEEEEDEESEDDSDDEKDNRKYPALPPVITYWTPAADDSGDDLGDLTKEPVVEIESGSESWMQISVTLPSTAVSLKRTSLQSVLDDLLRNDDKEECYRESSKRLLQSSLYFLSFFFHVEVPKLPVYCVEHIQ